MTRLQTLSRRAAIRLLFAAAALIPGKRLQAETGPAVKVYKEPTCGCCASWARHLTAAGFAVSVIEVVDIDPIKAKLGMPYGLTSCHTAEVAGYVIEGHIPATVIKRLLAEMPAAKGIAVPGMPVGSPGMEGGSPKPYEVILFGPNERKIYARCLGTQEI